jgi:hypothetical protein
MLLAFMTQSTRLSGISLTPTLDLCSSLLRRARCRCQKAAKKDSIEGGCRGQGNQQGEKKSSPPWRRNWTVPKPEADTALAAVHRTISGTPYLIVISLIHHSSPAATDSSLQPTYYCSPRRFFFTECGLEDCLGRGLVRSTSGAGCQKGACYQTGEELDIKPVTRWDLQL